VTNAIGRFELPVTDLDRAGDFYSMILGRKWSSADARRWETFAQGEGYLPTPDVQGQMHVFERTCSAKRRPNTADRSGSSSCAETKRSPATTDRL
jgi:predicted enzyme related to lactoylglutathione lyase